MTETIEGSQARTHVRGNLFSFVMPWEDIAKCCEQVLASKEKTKSQTGVEHMDDHPAALPQDEETLATWVKVHIVSGSSEFMQHLSAPVLCYA